MNTTTIEKGTEMTETATEAGIRFIVVREHLLDMLNTLAAVVPGRTHLPVLRCVRIAAADGRLTLETTNLSSAIRFTSGQVQVEMEGVVLVDCLRLKSIASELPDDTISLAVEGSQVRVRSNCADFKLYTEDAASFPPLPNGEPTATAAIPSATLARLLRQTLFAAADANGRYAFKGVLFHLAGKRLDLAATDTRRLSLCGAAVTGKGKADAIVPDDACRLLGKVLGDPEAEAAVAFTESGIRVTCGDATLFSNLVEGVFPPYDDIVPKDSPCRATVGRADFASAIRQASLVSTNKLGTGIKLTFGASGIQCQGRTPEAGEANVSVPCKYEGKDIEIGFEARYLGEALRASDADEITIDLTAPNRPALLNLGEGFRYVAMPRNLQ